MKRVIEPIVAPLDIDPFWETIDDTKVIAKTPEEKLEMLRRKVNELVYWQGEH